MLYNLNLFRECLKNKFYENEVREYSRGEYRAEYSVFINWWQDFVAI